MGRYGIIALLLCSQLIAPALSGQFVCLAANGCVCVDGGPETCHCCKRPAKVMTCSCGCHHEESTPSTELAEGSEGCSHIAIGDYESPVAKNQAAFETAALTLSIEPAVCETVPTTASLDRSSSLPDDSALLAVIATVVLRI
jgi:hypothetical protein